MSESLIESFLAIKETVRRLRAPDGCPWDQKQTHQSLRPYSIEEASEVVDVLDRVHDDKLLSQDIPLKNHLVEELGDLLLQILLHSEIAEGHGTFTIQDVMDSLRDKLIRRHPHVFGTEIAETSEDVIKNWEAIKQKEKAAPEHLLDTVPRSLPTLPRAQKIIDKVTKVGFQWPSALDSFGKLEEEVRELKQALVEKHSQAELEGEIADVLFCAINIAQLSKIDADSALRSGLAKFERRFNHVEAGIKSRGKKLEESTLAEMDEFWDEAKRLERAGK